MVQYLAVSSSTCHSAVQCRAVPCSAVLCHETPCITLQCRMCYCNTAANIGPTTVSVTVDELSVSSLAVLGRSVYSTSGEYCESAALVVECFIDGGVLH